MCIRDSNDGLPLPGGVTAFGDGGFSVDFDSLTDLRQWVEVTGAELKNGAERLESSTGAAITFYSGVFRGCLVSMFAHEAPELVGVPLEPATKQPAATLTAAGDGVQIYDASVED